MRFFPSVFSQDSITTITDTSENHNQMQLQLQKPLNIDKNVLTPLDYEIVVANELRTETYQIKTSLRETVELQNTLINQITIIDQENLDSIEKHIDNSISNMQQANKNLDTSQNNVPSLVNPFKNVMNIVNLLAFWKKN